MNRLSSATLIGLTAILLWSTLALATAATGKIPPFQLTAMTFLIGGLLGAASWLWRPGAVRALAQPWSVWLVGVGGLFGYHFLYFTALKLAPPAEAGLISYLWPLLIVLLSALLPGERLAARHVAGALMGFAGVFALFLSRGTLSVDPAYLPGYLVAFVCAFVWSGYSVLSSRMSQVPTDAVVGFCFATAIGAGISHLALEVTIWPASGSEWLAVVALGVGPLGLAFYAWDHGVKRGDIRLLGVASYAAPVLSTLLLVATGFAQPSWGLLAACALIVGGAVVATRKPASSGPASEPA